MKTDTQLVPPGVTVVVCGCRPLGQAHSRSKCSWHTQ